MRPVTIAQIVAQLERLPADQLAAVLDYVSRLVADEPDTPLAAMLASEAALSRDWDRPEEDAAWQNL